MITSHRVRESISPEPTTTHTLNRIEKLPPELLLQINKSLESYARAALALTSRTMLAEISPHCLRLSGKDLYNLLALVEKQGIYPDDILWPTCVKFHSSISPTAHALRACGKDIFKPGWTRGSAELPNQPRLAPSIIKLRCVVTIPFNLASAVMRSHNLAIRPPVVAANDLDCQFNRISSCPNRSFEWKFDTKCAFRVGRVTDPETGSEESRLLTKQSTYVSPVVVTAAHGLKRASIDLLRQLEGEFNGDTGRCSCCSAMHLQSDHLECF